VGDRELVGDGRLETDALLGDLERAQHLALGTEPADAYAGSHHLGRRVEQHGLYGHARLRRDRREGLALEAEVAVRVVLEQRHAGTDQHLGDRRSPLARHRAAGRVLERGDEVDQLGVVGLDGVGESVRQHPVLVAVDPDHPRADKGERLYGREVGGALDEDDVARSR
jgi:hypothetical protein